MRLSAPTLKLLDLDFNAISKTYEAPIHMKANNGVFILSAEEAAAATLAQLTSAPDFPLPADAEVSAGIRQARCRQSSFWQKYTVPGIKITLLTVFVLTV